MFPQKLIRWIGALLCAMSVQTFAQQTERQMLSGTGKDDAVPWDFMSVEGRVSGTWTKIPVPSNWEQFGFGVYNYGRQPYTKPTVIGHYKRTFQVPASWTKKRVFIVFDGAMTDTEVTINGQSAGPKHQGGFYQFRYEITKLLRPAMQNMIEATVSDESSEDSVNKAERRGDYWNFGGIYRPVYLEAVPQEFIERVAVDAKADGMFVMDVLPSGLTKADSIEAQIFSLDGKNNGEVFSQKIPANSELVKLETQIANPKTWTAETPNLYEVRVRLKQGATVLHELRKRFGFRTFEVRKDDGLYLNGKRILLKGVDRHSFWPDSGRALSPKISADDVKLIKEMNMNAVRMSHYPPDEHFLDKCDELGLYVLDELAGWHQHYATEIGQKLVREMVTRDVNHPCILFWDNGNEGGWNTELDGEFAKYDPQQRHILHPWAKSGDVDTKHYPTWSKLQELGAADMVWMPTEFLHGLDDGGGGAALNDYWNFMLHSRTAAGGFIWALLDEGVKRTDENGRIDVQNNLAPDGMVGPYREKEGSFFAIKEIWSPVFVDKPTVFDGVLAVENRYDFTNLNECNFKWQLRKFPKPDEAAKGFTVVAPVVLSHGIITTEGKAKTEVAPGEKGGLKLDLPLNVNIADALSLTVSDPSGHELWTWVWPIKGAAKTADEIVSKGKGEVRSSQDADSITLTAGGLVVRINRKTGELMEVTRGGKMFSLKNGPRLVAGEATLSGITASKQGDDQVVECSYTGALKSVRWTMHGSGWLTLEYAYELTGDYPFLGVSFDYPEAKVRDLKWLGDGPYRVYKNRLKGGALSVWQNKYNDAITGRTWQYPEFKGYFSDVRWAKLGTEEGPITMVIGDDNIFLRVLTPTLPKDPVNARADYPPGDISFLHGISAIGDKFHKAADAGPESGLNKASGTYKATVNFRFGESR